MYYDYEYCKGLEIYELESLVNEAQADIENRLETTYHGDQYLQDDWGRLGMMQEVLAEKIEELNRGFD